MPNFRGVLDTKPKGQAVIDVKSQNARAFEAKPKMEPLRGEVSYQATELLRGMPILPFALWVTYPETQVIRTN